MPKKGGQFERDTCRQLSLWWSGGESDDLFWRTSQSGGRATTRFRSGRGTRGHCGDVTNTDGEGAPLIELITFELKRGYNRTTIHDLFDKSENNKKQGYELFVEQAIHAAERADTPFWAIIHKRDMRQPAILIPLDVFDHFVNIGCRFNGAGACVSIRTEVGGLLRTVKFSIVPLTVFLRGVDRGDVLSLRKFLKRRRQ